MSSDVGMQRDRVTTAKETVLQKAKSLIANHPVLRGRELGLDYQLEGDLLIIRGAVPSFYLKQVLQSALKELEGVNRVDNQVDVVSSQGLSGAK